MSSAIATINPSQTALTIPDARRDVIRNVFAPGATDDEFDVFVSICNRVRLDPARKQIYFFKRRDKQQNRDVMSTVTGIDGFRAVAERTGLYEGQAKHLWCGRDGAWKDVWLDRDPPAACMVGVFKKGFREPLYAVATLSSYGKFYDNKLSGNWSFMTDVMLSKCAEALALRRAFPDDLGGLYTQDELDHADAGPRADVVTTSPQASEPAKNAVQKTKDAVRAKKQAAEQRPTIVGVLAGIDAAETLAELDRIGALGNKLDADDKAKAREAFKLKKQTLKRNADLVDNEPPHDEHGEVKQEGFDYGPPPMSDEDARSWSGDES